MEVILLWKKTKTFFGLSIFPNIITKKWGYRLEIEIVILERYIFPRSQRTHKNLKNVKIPFKNNNNKKNSIDLKGLKIVRPTSVS